MGIYRQRFDTSVGVSHLYARHPSLFKFLVFRLLPYWILFAKIFQDSLSSACLEIYCNQIFFFSFFFFRFYNFLYNSISKLWHVDFDYWFLMMLENQQ